MFPAVELAVALNEMLLEGKTREVSFPAFIVMTPAFAGMVLTIPAVN
jgi:hypothetical protein